MNAREIQQCLISERWLRGSTVVPNFTPPGWWECDVFEVTKAGFFREYEIKLTTADFRADSKKASRHISGQFPNFKETFRFKHALLTEGAPVGPSCFYFVAPKGVIPEGELPRWAGLIICEPILSRRGGIMTRISKKAPNLHRVKLGDKIIQDAHRTSYYRFIRLFLTTRTEITNRNENQQTENEAGAMDNDALRDQTQEQSDDRTRQADFTEAHPPGEQASGSGRAQIPGAGTGVEARA